MLPICNCDDKKDAIITALIGSAENIVSESKEGPLRDAGLLATAQKIEHYEIASYGSARDWAKTLGLSQHADVLQKTLAEEKHADQYWGPSPNGKYHSCGSVAAISSVSKKGQCWAALS